jgi:hypothetical protein
MSIDEFTKRRERLVNIIKKKNFTLKELALFLLKKGMEQKEMEGFIASWNIMDYVKKDKQYKSFMKKSMELMKICEDRQLDCAERKEFLNSTFKKFTTTTTKKNKKTTRRRKM